MICVYPPDCTDFSSNGLGPVNPSLCTVTETLNGEWELTLEHPLDAQGKWRRLIEGNILRAPVPAAMTPQVKLISSGSGKAIYKVSTSRDPLRLRSGTGTKYKVLGKYKKGTEVVVLSTANPSWYEVSCPDGKRGYMASQYLTYVRTEATPGQAAKAVVEPRQLRDQPFRIYRAVPELTKITIYARHVFYDLMDNMLKTYKPAANVTGAVVVQNISTKCLTEHDFTFYSDLDSTADEVEFENINPVDALLGEGGVVEKYGGELARDWFDAFVVKRVGSDTDVQIREGKNLLGISYDVDLTDVVTRIMPTGETKDGKTLYLDELYLDSLHIGAHPHPKWIHLAVSEAKVSKDMTTAQAKTKMRSAAQAEYDKGCDLPTVTLKVDFINCAQTEEYRQYAALQNIFLGDAVRVIARRIGVAVSMRLTQYTYDCLTRKYTAMTLGTVADTIEGNIISSRQLASGTISGAKLAVNSVGAGQLRDGSVGSLQIGLAAIQTAHIETAAITSALIQHAAIQTAHIGEAQITAAQIADASITAAKIASATITAAQIANATITSAQIADASISAAKIALATITSAQIAEAAIDSARIADLAVTNAKIANAAIDTAKIKDASITNAKIAEAAIGQANIQDAAIGEAQIHDAAITFAKIADLAVSTAHIGDLAVTTAKIAQGAITNAKIGNAAIDTAKIALGAITQALIEDGAIGTAQIADASITDAKIVELSANRITAGVLSVERLIIRGSEQSLIYAINNMGELVSTQVDTIDGYVLTERSITADRIVAHSITADEIAARSITANEILAGTITGDEIAAASITGAHVKAGTLTTSHVVANFGETLLLESSESVRSIVLPDIDEAIAGISVGGVNLIENSASHTLVGDDTDTYWTAADELAPNTTYTFSVREIVKDAGAAAGVTWALVNVDTLVMAETGTLEFTYGKQARTFTTPNTSANWSFVLYAGLVGATNGVTVTFGKAQLEEGGIATGWRAAPQDTEAQFGNVGDTIDRLDEGFGARVQALIDGMGLSDRFASTDEFLDLLDRVDVVRSDLNQQESNMTLTFTRLAAAEDGITQLFSHFEFGDDGGTPYLDMWASASSMKMRLTNTRLAFIQGSREVAYFSDNKLYVTQLEVIERISIGTAANGYLDIVTTPTGVGFKWRS